MLIIEVDGITHDNEQIVNKDKQREEDLEKKDLRLFDLLTMKS